MTASQQPRLAMNAFTFHAQLNIHAAMSQATWGLAGRRDEVDKVAAMSGGDVFVAAEARQ